MSELIDVLDEQGNKTGTTLSRKEVHASGCWHATVHIYVYRLVDNKVQLLTHLRSAKKDLYPSTWDPVLGGHVQSGHDELETVVDEMEGEVGLKVSPKDLVVGPVVKADKGNDKEFNHLFAFAFPEQADLIFTDHEVQEVRWIDVDAVLNSLPSRDWRPTAAEFMHAYAFLQSLPHF